MGPKWLLIVDDDESIRVVLAELFRSEGYRVITAKNGHEALAALDTARFDALLVDLAMPVMDGIEFRRVLRERGSRTPFIAMTAGFRHPTEVARVLEATAYLIKPFDLDMVVATVADAID